MSTQPLTHKQILVGVSGGIAAYKSAELVRRLQDLGAEVRVVMTPAAQEFITPLTLQALSGNPVHTDMLDHNAEAAMGHIELARWADAIIIAPASADVIARLAQGQGNDLLTTVCLARRCDLLIAPAMNQAMWSHQATQANLKTLVERGVIQLGPASGGQACGDVGMGRMEEPGELAQAVAEHFQAGTLAGRHFVITAGPTREAIDPVRYISNHSSGKMGYALAQAAIDQGARVTLISGPTNIPVPPKAELINIISAEDMLAAAMSVAESCDVFIGSAAVADFRPAHVATQKMKKTSADTMTIEMVKNPDVIATIAKLQSRPLVVGFAAETEHVIEYAKAKRERKQLDMVIANNVADQRIGFNSDDNAVTLITAEQEHPLALASKAQLAREIIHFISNHLLSAYEKE